MTEWILSSSILILIVIAIRTVFKGKISLRLQYAIWGLVLLRLLIPVSFGSTDFSVANLTNQTETPSLVIQSTKPNENMQVNQHAQVPQVQPDQIPSQNHSQNEPVTVEKNFDLSTYAVYIAWAVGFICVSVTFLYTNFRFRNRILKSRYDLDVRKNNLEVYATDEIDTPCLFGVKNPAIYVTYPVADDKTFLRHTLEHEATHHRHGDHIWAVLRCVCLAIHWYNPLVWWAAFLSQRDAELACDEATIKKLGEGERAEYGRTLIGMTCQKRANVLITATTMATGKSGLKERILLIAKKPKMAIYTLIAVILIASVAVGCTFTGAKDDSTGDLTGTKVFSNQSEVTGMAIHALPDAYTLVDASHLSEMAEWALGFEYGEIIDSNKVMDPGSNTFSVTLYYADGTEQTSYLDFEIVNDITYAIVRDETPSCWDDIWYTEETVQTELIEAVAGNELTESIYRNMVSEQSFDLSLNDWGAVTFVPCMPDPDSDADPLTDASFYLIRDGKLLYRFPDVAENNVRETGLCENISFVFFADSNEDFRDDVIIGVQYISGAGPQGMIPYTEVRIYEDSGNSSFVYNETLSQEINSNLPAEATAEYVREFLANYLGGQS